MFFKFGKIVFTEKLTYTCNGFPRPKINKNMRTNTLTENNQMHSKLLSTSNRTAII